MNLLVVFFRSCDLYAKAAVSARAACKLARRRRMICEKRLPHLGHEYGMALRADIRHAVEVIARNKHAVYYVDYRPDHKRPPDAKVNPDNGSRELQ